MEENKHIPNVIFLNFADNSVPQFKELRNKDWILFGEDNLFPKHLLYLYDKSSNHNAIVNGKAFYIIGNGFQDNPVINDGGETLKKVSKKAVIDIELYGGFYLQFVWKMGGKASVTHIPFEDIRKSKDKPGYFYCKEWDWKKHKKVEPQYIPAFDPENKTGAQLFCYREYRPGCKTYPLPGYFGALNDIETDVEISIYNLSIMKNGQFSGKLISFFDGVPTQEEQKKLEAKWTNKFIGSGNAGKTMLAFNRQEAKEPQVADLSTTDLDKLFEILNKTVQGEIFSGHQVTSPMLFGIKTEGQLGGRSEIIASYEIFKNTYINAKQEAFEEVINYLAPFMGVQPNQKLQPVDPVGVILEPIDFKEILPREWILEKLGIDPLDYPDTNVSGTPAAAYINENLKNLTGRQSQGIERIIRKYKSGRITKPMAETMLRSGLGLNDNEISTFLNFARIESEDEVAEMFSAIGKPKSEYVILKQKQTFNGVIETMSGHEEQLFKDLKQNDSDIVNLIGKDKRITPEVIAKTIHESVAYVRGRIEVLKQAGVLTESIERIGPDTIIEHAINPEQIDKRPPPETADVFIRYSYEPKPGLEPLIKTSRPFCIRLIELDRLYTRGEIESISQRVGFSVWDRKGGFWGDKEECRHRWVSNIVIKKRT
jgi:hypothetical protein